MRFLLLFIILILFNACGPINSSVTIRDAELEVKKAYRIKAHEKAPYYYYKAKAYLVKAKNERAYSDFSEADDFASKSVKMAKKAISISSKDETALLEENELKIKRSSTDTRDSDENLEIKSQETIE